MSFQQADLLLIDGRHALWRAVDKFDELSITTAEGEVEETGTIYGFLTILCKLHATFGGSAIICWDDWVNGPSERLAMYPEYKHKHKAHGWGEVDITKQTQDEEKKRLVASMAKQQARLMWILGLFGIPQAWSAGWEADDVLGTLAAKLDNGSRNIGIFTGDRDLYQCVNPRVNVIRPVKGGGYKVCGVEEVVEEYGIAPARFAELKALAGDTGDNIPGISGIGPKKAALILEHFETAEEACAFAVYGQEANAKGYTRKIIGAINDRMEKMLAAGQESALLSRRLAQINCSAKLAWAEFQVDRHEVTQELVRMKFHTVLRGGRLDRLLEMGFGIGV